MLPIVWLNGAAIDFERPALSVFERGFTRGDGAFETMRAYDGRIFELDRHMARLERSLATLRITPDRDVRAEVLGALAQAVSEGELEVAVRVTVSRGVAAGFGLSPVVVAACTVVSTVQALPEFPARHYSGGVSLQTASGRRNERAPTAGIKTIDYADAVVATMEAQAAGADDALLLDTRGFVSEAPTSNLFFHAYGTLITPALNCGVLPGITRAVVMELADGLGIPLEEREVLPEELHAADEAFLTSSLREITPLVRVDGQPIGTGVPGQLTRSLMATFRTWTRGQ